MVNWQTKTDSALTMDIDIDMQPIAEREARTEGPRVQNGAPHEGGYGNRNAVARHGDAWHGFGLIGKAFRAREMWALNARVKKCFRAGDLDGVAKGLDEGLSPDSVKIKADRCLVGGSAEFVNFSPSAELTMFDMAINHGQHQWVEPLAKRGARFNACGRSKFWDWTNPLHFAVSMQLAGRGEGAAMIVACSLACPRDLLALGQGEKAFALMAISRMGDPGLLGHALETAKKLHAEASTRRDAFEAITEAASQADHRMGPMSTRGEQMCLSMLRDHLEWVGEELRQDGSGRGDIAGGGLTAEGAQPQESDGQERVGFQPAQEDAGREPALQRMAKGAESQKARGNGDARGDNAAVEQMSTREVMGLVLDQLASMSERMARMEAELAALRSVANGSPRPKSTAGGGAGSWSARLRP